MAGTKHGSGSITLTISSGKRKGSSKSVMHKMSLIKLGKSVTK